MMQLPWPVFLALSTLGLVIVVLSIRFLLQVLSRSKLFEAEILEETPLRFEASGPVVLHLEGPIRYRHRPGLKISVFDPQVGSDLEVRRTLPSRVAGMRRARFSMVRFEVKHPGEYRVTIANPEKLREESDWRFVLARPTGVALPGAILGIVFGGMALIFGLVAAVIRLQGGAP